MVYLLLLWKKKSEKVFIDMHKEVLNMKVKKIKKTNLKFFIGQVLMHNTSGFHTGKEK
jgi:DNA polymerase III delta prime subunit